MNSIKSPDESIIDGQETTIRNLHLKIKELHELLAIEFMRHNRIQTPWDCVEEDCPHLGKPVPRSGCNCFLDFQKKHVAKVKTELGI